MTILNTSASEVNIERASEGQKTAYFHALRAWADLNTFTPAQRPPDLAPIPDDIPTGRKTAAFLAEAAAQVPNRPLPQIKIDLLRAKAAAAAEYAADRPVNTLRPIKHPGTVTFERQGGVLRAKYHRAGGAAEHGKTFETGWNKRNASDADLLSEYPADLAAERAAYSKLVRGNKRKITTFSAASRNNLLDLLNSISDRAWYRAKFVTLTYHEEIPNHAVAMRDIEAFFKRLQRYVTKHDKRGIYNVSMVWRLEVKERLSGLNMGEPAPHFHLFLFNCPFVERSILLKWWREITRDKTIDRVEIKAVRNRRKAAAIYIAKYTAKSDLELDSPAYLVLALYLADGGRNWGVMGREALPVAAVQSVTLPVCDEGVSRLLAFCEGHWSFLMERWSVGFRVFCFEGLEWLDAVIQECLFPSAAGDVV